MVDHVKKYYNEFLTRGKEALASQLFDDDIVHKDLVWVRRDGKGSAWVGWRSAAALPSFPLRTPTNPPELLGRIQHTLLWECMGCSTTFTTSGQPSLTSP